MRRSPYSVLVCLLLFIFNLDALAASNYDSIDVIIDPVEWTRASFNPVVQPDGQRLRVSAGGGDPCEESVFHMPVHLLSSDEMQTAALPSNESVRNRPGAALQAPLAHVRPVGIGNPGVFCSDARNSAMAGSGAWNPGHRGGPER